MHDFGKLILSKHITPNRSKKLAAFHSANPGSRPIDAERTVLGTDHAQTGAIVARYWNLPDAIVTAIQNHHDPADWDDPLTNGVILANQIALENANFTEFAWEAEEIVANAMMALKVDDQMYDAVAEESRVRFEHLIELFE